MSRHPRHPLEARLYANDGYTLLATSRKFEVSPTGVSIRNLTANAVDGEVIKVAWNGVDIPTSADWVGIYTPGSKKSDYKVLSYTDGSSSGSLSFLLNSGNLIVGETYEMRLYPDVGSVNSAKNEPFVLLCNNYIPPKDRIYYIHNDHLGTPKVLTNSFGQSVWNSMSTPFGSADVNDDVDGDGVAVEFNIRQPGQYYDAESGLYYNYFRYYDPSTGRYITSDPIGLNGGLNTYAYVENNPLGYIDPLGLVGMGSRAATTRTLPLPPGGSTTTFPALPNVKFPSSASDAITNARNNVLCAMAGLCSLNEADDGSDSSSDEGGDSSCNQPKKKSKPKTSGKNGAKDVLSWAKGEKPFEGESGNDFADRLLGDKYGNGNFPKGPKSEHNKIKKWGDRSFF